MPLKQISSKIDYNRNCYLSDLDLINKYNLLDKKQIPSLNQIVISLPINTFLNNLVDSNFSQFDSEPQIKAFLLLFLLNSTAPYVDFKCLALVKSKENFLSLRLSLMGADSINDFLVRLFIETNSTLNLNLSPIEDSLNQVKFSSLRKKKFTLTSFVLVQKFFELELMLNRILFGINSNELLLKINFIFHNPAKLNVSHQTIIQNSSFFWIKD